MIGWQQLPMAGALWLAALPAAADIVHAGAELCDHAQLLTRLGQDAAIDLIGDG